MAPKKHAPVPELYFLRSELVFLDERLEALLTQRLAILDENDQILLQQKHVRDRINLLTQKEAHAQKIPQP